MEEIMENYSFFDLFCQEVKEIYASEMEIVNHLPTIISSAHSKELKETLSNYLNEVKLHLNSIEKCCSEFQVNLIDARCTTTLDILKEAQELINACENSPVRDAAIIAVIQSLQHYKMSLYGTARTFARHLNINKAMDLFQRALNNEGEADRSLTRLAEGGIFTTGINEEAVCIK